jgi:chitin synthase
MMSMGTMGGEMPRRTSPYQDAVVPRQSIGNLRGMSNTPPTLGVNPRMSTATGLSLGRPGLQHSDTGRGSTGSFDFQRGNIGPDDVAIIDAIQAVLREVDLDTVTKKQVRALVEQRLQTELVGERRTFMDRQIDNELANM